jgi:hypothetical protein
VTSSTEHVREQVARPGRSTYRAKRGPVVEALESDGWCILVTRTHDVDLAAALAFREMQYYYGTDCVLPHATVGWFRRVPWDALGLGVDYTWLNAKSGVLFYRRDS